MQANFLAVDHLKISWVIEESLQKLKFLAKISKEDGTSSELAGYEINKLLSEQMRLEETYAELLKVRGTLKGISNKRRLEEVQQEIEQIAHALKENTRKLGRLFRENPSFEKDTEKVNNEKAELVEKLESVINASYQNFSLVNLQASLIDDIEAQDFLRKQNIKEQGLIQEIKQLHSTLKREEDEYQNLTVEKQAHIQKQKENLAKARTTAHMEKTNKGNEIKALEGTQQRIQGQNLVDLQDGIEQAEKKKEMEVEAYAKISVFLKKQEAQNKEKISQWTAKLESNRVDLEGQLENLANEKAKALAKLQKLKAEFEQADGRRKEKEQQRLEKDQEKQRKVEEEEKLEEAVRAIQENYKAWKEAGGEVKKPKKAKKEEGKAKGK